METQVKEIRLKAEDAFDRRKWKGGVKRTAVRWIRQPPWKRKNLDLKHWKKWSGLFAILLTLFMSYIKQSFDITFC